MKFPLSFLTLAPLALCPLFAQMPGGQAPTVQVDKVTLGTDKVSRRSIGHMESVRKVHVRTSVEGYLLDSPLQEGSIVNAGDVIFRIDPTRYQAAYDQALAAVAQLDAQIAYADGRNERMKKLVGTQATSKEEKETALAQLEELRAKKIAAEATLAQRKKDLDDCTIKAEITGRISREEAAPGNYILRGKELATLSQVDPMYVRFPLSQRDVIGVFRGPQEITNIAEVTLRTADGRNYPTPGKIAIVDNLLSVNTDSYTLWAEFPNKDGKLTSRGIGAVFVNLSSNSEVMLIPITAIHYDATSAYCYVVGDKNIVQRRDIVTGRVQGRLQSVYSGLKEGEVVISDGAHKTRVNTPVTPVLSEKTAAQTPEEAAAKEHEAAPLPVQTAQVTLAADPTVLTSQGARVESMNSVFITPMVQGILAKPHFEEGSMVKKGDVLFSIDPSRYQAAVDAQKANIAQLEVALRDAQSKEERQNYLLERQATSRDEMERAQAATKELLAKIQSAKAALVVAEDDLDRCTIRAFMDGHIGRTLVTEGNYIIDSTPLALLIQMSPIYVRFALSETEILTHFGNAEAMKQQVEINIITATGQKLPTQGSIAFYDNAMQTATDTQNCWAVFPNDDGIIQPGGVVTIELRRKADVQVPMVPENAVMLDSLGRYVFVPLNGRAVRRNILCGPLTSEGKLPVFAGLNAGESIIIDQLAVIQQGSRIAVVAPASPAPEPSPEAKPEEAPAKAN